MGHPIEERVLLPAAYIVTLAFRKQHAAEIHECLTTRMKTEKCEAELLSDKIAHHEWEHRFRIMTVKRLGTQPGSCRSRGPAIRTGRNDVRGGEKGR